MEASGSVGAARDPLAYLLIGVTILLTVGGQLLTRKAMLEVGALPDGPGGWAPFLLKAYSNWKVYAALALAVLASFAWLGTVSRTDISFAYPFMGLAIALVLCLAPPLFGEHVPAVRWAGLLLVCLGLWIASRR